jgi:hypothetical protein
MGNRGIRDGPEIRNLLITHVLTRLAWVAEGLKLPRLSGLMEASQRWDVRRIGFGKKDSQLLPGLSRPEV